jgi:transposase
MLSLVTPEKRVPADHPLRAIKVLADKALQNLSPVFEGIYSKVGRPSVPPEMLLKASLLMAFYSIRSERQFCEQLDYNILFRWFLDMNMDEDSFDHSSFSTNRKRLLEMDVANLFFKEVVSQARARKLMSEEHFTVDGTLIEAWASSKSFRPREEKESDRTPPDDPGNPSVDFRGEKRSNQTHQSTTDPEARLARKGDGKEAKLSYSGNALMENRNGLLVDFLIEEANGYAERKAALEMIDRSLPGQRRVTLGADRGFNKKQFIEDCRARNVTAHVAKYTSERRSSNIDRRTTRHVGYSMSQKVRKRIEEIFGWMKTIGGFRQTRFKGKQLTQFAGYLVATAYNLLRMAKLAMASA